MNDDERTTAYGLYCFGHSYWRSAAALRKIDVRATHPDDPVWFLYCHAVELFLKAYLRAEGASVNDLRRRYGHGIVRLAKIAEEKGLHFDDEDHQVVTAIEQMGITTVRYIRRGPFTRPSLGGLDRTCKSFHQSIRYLLKTKGHRIRRYALRADRARG
jgi:hypothetical protein